MGVKMSDLAYCMNNTVSGHEIVPNTGANATNVTFSLWRPNPGN